MAILAKRLRERGVRLVWLLSVGQQSPTLHPPIKTSSATTLLKALRNASYTDVWPEEHPATNRITASNRCLRAMWPVIEMGRYQPLLAVAFYHICRRKACNPVQRHKLRLWRPQKGLEEGTEKVEQDPEALWVL